MARKAEETVGTQEAEEEFEQIAEEALHKRGRAPEDVVVLVREMANVFKALKLTQIEELAIGSYFIPMEGQIGIEGILNSSAEYMNRYIKAGWQPWQVATPYSGKYAFNIDGVTTGNIDGQWITIIWARPPELT